MNKDIKRPVKACLIQNRIFFEKKHKSYCRVTELSSIFALVVSV